MGTRIGDNITDIKSNIIKNQNQNENEKRMKQSNRWIPCKRSRRSFTLTCFIIIIIFVLLFCFPFLYQSFFHSNYLSLLIILYILYFHSFIKNQLLVWLEKSCTYFYHIQMAISWIYTLHIQHISACIIPKYIVCFCFDLHRWSMYKIQSAIEKEEKKKTGNRTCYRSLLHTLFWMVRSYTPYTLPHDCAISTELWTLRRRAVDICKP